MVEKYRSLAASADIIEAAHMELAEPSIPTAYRKCVERGASHIICHPYFLSPGRHVQKDIPAIIAGVAKEFPNVTYDITPPLGSAQRQIVELIQEIVEKKKKEDSQSE